MLYYLLKLSVGVAMTAAGLYGGLLLLLTTTFFQTHAVYLHAFQMTGSKDLDVPEHFGFLRGQVAPFSIPSSDGVILHAWHILPIGLYRSNEEQLLQEPAGLRPDITSSQNFRLLRDDPEALLVLYFHGAGGNVGSGHRIPSYRALSAGSPDKVHIFTFDYRGFGRSSGSPSERGVIKDALAVTEWALDVAQVPPSRMLIFSQSMGTAVNMAVADHYASLEEAIAFAGHMLIAPFADVTSLVTTYKIAKTVPLLSPVAKYPVLFDWLKRYIRDDWSTRDRIASYVRKNEAASRKYRITLLHAEDDYDIPWHHTPTLFWHAVDASTSTGIKRDDLEQWKSTARRDLGAAGLVTCWQTKSGLISEHILKYGLHDVIMGTPIVTLVTMQIFESINLNL